MADTIINYKNLPNHLFEWNDPRAAAMHVRENLRRIDPNRDGKLTKSEVMRYYPLLDWNILYANFAKFYQAWQKVSSSCRGTPISRLCSVGSGSSNNIVRVANIVPFGVPVDRTPRLHSAEWLCRAVQSQIIIGRIDSSDVGYTVEKLVRIDFSRLHPIKEYKIERDIGYSVNKKNIVVNILHFSGKLSVLKGNLNDRRTFRFTKNPTGAPITRHRFVDPSPGEVL